MITTPKTKKSNRMIKMPKFLCEEMQEYLQMLYGLNILSNYDKNYTGVISIDGEKMNKVDYLDMPVAYAMDQPIFFTHDILKNL